MGRQGVSTDRAHEDRSRQSDDERDAQIRLLARIVESSDDAIISKTLGGVITSWNKAAERVFGYTALEAVGRDTSIIEVPKLEGEPADNLEQTRIGHRVDHYQTVRRRKDGKRIDIWLTVSPILDASGQMIGVSMVARDITEVKRVEDELRRVAAELQERNADLLRSNQELDDFAYIASHDLKEPLRGIHNFATFLIEDYADKIDEAGKSKLETLKVLTERMYALIDSLLEFARVGRADLAIQKTDLNTLLNEVVSSLRILLDEKGVQLRIPVPLPVVLCDRVRIGEVFRNLITNAIKYNDKSARLIEIGWQADPAAPSVESLDGGSGARPLPIVFSVRDNGIGIHQKHFESIFRIFKRLHGQDKFGGGTGFGLTIVKKIIERHNGRVWVESKMGEGTTFSFILGGEDARNGGAASDPGGRR